MLLAPPLRAARCRGNGPTPETELNPPTLCAPTVLLAAVLALACGVAAAQASAPAPTAAATAASADPAEAHRRGMQAYRRGDVVAAMSALRPAARAGHAPSQTMLAFILMQAGEDAEAARLYREAAAQGYAEGHYGYGGMLQVGRGVAKDEKAALEQFSKAAALGHGPAIELVATAWAARQMGADPAAQPAVARAAWLKAAEQGHLPSAELLAQAYRKGEYGLPVDEAQAKRWAEQARQWRQQRAAASRPAK